jgi:hypothetical protein
VAIVEPKVTVSYGSEYSHLPLRASTNSTNLDVGVGYVYANPYLRELAGASFTGNVMAKAHGFAHITASTSPAKLPVS